MNFAELMEEMGNILGFDGLCPLEDGDIILEMDGISLSIQLIADDIIYFTNLGTLPEHRADMCRFLLESNQSGAMGGYIGLDMQNRVITFVNKVPLRHADAPHLADVLYKHVDAALALTATLDELARNEPEQSDRQGHQAFEGHFLKV